MSATAPRPWAAQFAPPPPPPIGRRDEARRDEEPADGTLPDPAVEGDAGEGESDLDAGVGGELAPAAPADRAGTVTTTVGRGPQAVSVEAGVDGVPELPEGEGGAEERHTPAALEQAAPAAHLRSVTLPAQREVTKSPTGRASAFAGRPEQTSPTSADEMAVRPMVDYLASVGVGAHLVAATRSERGRTFDLRLADPARVDLVLSLGSELAEVADADQVLPSHGLSAGEVRLDVLLPPEQGPSRQTAIWVPVAVREAVQAERSKTDDSATAVFLEAFNNQYANLANLFPRRMLSAGPMPVTKARRRSSAIARTQLWLYLNAEQCEVLDTAVADSGAGSRSALVTRILEAEFNLTPPRA